MGDVKGYKPKVTVVRQSRIPGNYDWREKGNGGEAAYLVRGLPMPGQKVRDTNGFVGTVTGIWPWVDREFEGRGLKGRVSPYGLTPYDPESALLERVSRAIEDAGRSLPDMAKAAIAAVREADRG